MQRCGKCDGAAQPGTAYLNGTPYCEKCFKALERRTRAMVACEPCPLTDADLEILAAAPSPEFSAMLAGLLREPPRHVSHYRSRAA